MYKPKLEGSTARSIVGVGSERHEVRDSVLYSMHAELVR